MKNKVQFIINKIKRYGIIGIWKYTFIKYSCQFLFSTGWCRYFTINGSGFKIGFSRTNVARVLYLFPNLHDGDVHEIKILLGKPILQNELKNKSLIFVDLGANIGTITLPVANIIKDNGVVYSIEAHPKIYFELLKNIKLNKLQNVRTFQIAIAERNGIVAFSDQEFDDMNHVESTAGDNQVQVPCLTLDTLFKDFEKIDILKIDVEGYEKFVLENGLETLNKTKYVYMEYLEETCNKFGYERAELKEFLERKGFICHLSDPSIHQNPGIDNLICKNLKFKKDENF